MSNSKLENVSSSNLVNNQKELLIHVNSINDIFSYVSFDAIKSVLGL